MTADNTPIGAERDRPARIFVLTNDDGVVDVLRRSWPSSRVDWKMFRDPTRAVETVFVDPPDLMLIDVRSCKEDLAATARLVRSESVHRQIPIVLLLDGSLVGNFDPAGIEADDFLTLPIDPDEVRARLLLAMLRAERGMDANPLTRLPGNTTIIRRIRQGVEAGENFALGCLDIDGFRAFNEHYGFPRGDEVLMMTARVLVNCLRSLSPHNFFVGHGGGDDFVFLCDQRLGESICKAIISEFDDIVPSFYDKQDRDAGAITLTTRDGVVQKHPLLTVSIGITTNKGRRLKHFGQAASVAKALANHAKREKKSSYALDRRRTPQA